MADGFGFKGATSGLLGEIGLIHLLTGNRHDGLIEVTMAGTFFVGSFTALLFAAVSLSRIK